MFPTEGPIETSAGRALDGIFALNQTAMKISTTEQEDSIHVVRLVAWLMQARKLIPLR